MKNSIKRYVGFILCAFIILPGSCSKNPLDKKIDEMEAVVIKMERISHVQNPSEEEITNLRKDLLTAGTSFTTMANTPELRDIKPTESQKKRILDVMMKMERLNDDPGFQHIKVRLKVTNLNY